MVSIFVFHVIYSPIASTVWIISTGQLLDWMQNPVPASELNNLDSFKCSTPQVDPSMKICNGIPQNEAGLLSHCAFSDFPFFTCVRDPQLRVLADDMCLRRFW